MGRRPGCVCVLGGEGVGKELTTSDQNQTRRKVSPMQPQTTLFHRDNYSPQITRRGTTKQTTKTKCEGGEKGQDLGQADIPYHTQQTTTMQ